VLTGVVGRLARTGLRKGVLGGSRPWLYTGIAAVALRAVQYIARAQAQTVYAEELKPGQRLEIRILPPDTR
jgi:hypothetical protein